MTYDGSVYDHLPTPALEHRGGMTVGSSSVRYMYIYVSPQLTSDELITNFQNFQEKLNVCRNGFSDVRSCTSVEEIIIQPLADFV